MEIIKVQNYFDVPSNFTGIVEYEAGSVLVSSTAPGTIEYYKNGKLHREDGPAHISPIREIWFIEGYCHREDGPAIIYSSGEKEWRIRGERISPMEIFDNLSDEEKEKIIWNLDEWK